MEPSAAEQDAEHLSRDADQASQELREAIIAADHARAGQASTRYVAVLQKLWQALPEQERARSSIPAKARELLDWARQMTVIQRSVAGDQLQILQKVSRYQNTVSPYAGLQIKG